MRIFREIMTGTTRRQRVPNQPLVRKNASGDPHRRRNRPVEDAQDDPPHQRTAPMVGKKRYRPEDDAQNQPQVKQGSKTDIHVASPYGCRVQACGELRLIRLVAQVRPSLGLTWVQESSFPSCAHPFGFASGEYTPSFGFVGNCSADRYTERALLKADG